MAVIKGLDELQRKLKDNCSLNDVRRVIKQNGAELQTKMQDKAEFTKGYQTGTTKRSIGLNFEDAGMTARVGPTTEYAEYLEYGTRFMEAQPFVKPALEEQKVQFKEDMKKLTK